MRSSLVAFLNVTKLGFNPDKALEMNPDLNIFEQNSGLWHHLSVRNVVIKSAVTCFKIKSTINEF